ncbi:group II intron reverse transcriptase/maturase [Pusillimonas noertemannii]|uniref:RNA-directed DNA polymerase n=1 Tax=Pusillimonas noertemannii TaxID=305977 RepID=A0A2U1CGV9_9BURK|nr:group II intron reverse transcriptase/maturase [Pusillimonas noertemannii]NYT70806.1 group II intron reverse transcriptase/maturase [Pusillimonas noertemannii]PVY60152.1 group II intron reverse transcriptase/maturase [Pusillimonas noertemannii]TFL07920.1 group II intron reverse transcriptase/maturase [Pusillimonas noertemannii]
MAMQLVLPQMAAWAERTDTTHGEAEGHSLREETSRPRPVSEDTGSALLQAALTRENLKRAFKRVRANKGAAGVDGLDIDQTSKQLALTWPAIREQLLTGTYRPSPVRRVMIPKPDGSQRELGIPTVTDRLIQQALLQVLQPLLDPSFSEHSYGFRPGRRAQDAVLAARAYVQSGRSTVVDVDLEKFFDRVNHDILIDRLQKRIADAGVIRLIRAYLNSGIMDDGLVSQREQGTPQGGPLSPLLANVLLDEVDKELERRGHCFVRYADDCNVYVRSHRAGQRVMALMKRLYRRLHLTLNDGKSAVADVFAGRKFLGFSLWPTRTGEIRIRVAAQPMETLKHRIRQITRRNGGRSLLNVVLQLKQYLQGWKAYFSLAQTPSVMFKLDQWVRHRLRAMLLKQWRHGRAVYRELAALGASRQIALITAAQVRHWWKTSNGLIHQVLTIEFFNRLGLPRLA